MPAPSTPRSTESSDRIWWVYMVRAENGHLYTGISTDPHRRFEQHRQGRGARFFNRSPAAALVWHARCDDHSDALRRERQIKSLTRSAKERLITGFDGQTSSAANGFDPSSAAAKLLALSKENNNG